MFMGVCLSVLLRYPQVLLPSSLCLHQWWWMENHAGPSKRWRNTNIVNFRRKHWIQLIEFKMLSFPLSPSSHTLFLYPSIVIFSSFSLSSPSRGWLWRLCISSVWLHVSGQLHSVSGRHVQTALRLPAKLQGETTVCVWCIWSNALCIPCRHSLHPSVKFLQ